MYSQYESYLTPKKGEFSPIPFLPTYIKAIRYTSVLLQYPVFIGLIPEACNNSLQGLSAGFRLCLNRPHFQISAQSYSPLRNQKSPNPKPE